MGPIQAVGCLLTGVRITLTERSIRKPMITGIIVNALAFAALLALFVWAATALGGAIAGIDADTGFGWLDWLVEALLTVSGPLLTAALVAGFLFIAPAVFTLLSGILLPMFRAASWNAARDWAGGPPVVGKREGLKVEAELIALEVRRLFRLLGVSALALLINLLPVVGQAAYLVVQFLIAARAMGWDLMSYHFELHDLSYDEQLRWLNRRPIFGLTLGAAAMGLMMIPMAQLLFATTNVAGAGIISARLDGAPPVRR